MKKFLSIFLLLIFFATTSVNATTSYNKNGVKTGSYKTSGNKTTQYDKSGSKVGTYKKSGNTVTS